MKLTSVTDEFYAVKRVSIEIELNKLISTEGIAFSSNEERIAFLKTKLIGFLLSFLPKNSIKYHFFSTVDRELLDSLELDLLITETQSLLKTLGQKQKSRLLNHKNNINTLSKLDDFNINQDRTYLLIKEDEFSNKKTLVLNYKLRQSQWTYKYMLLDKAERSLMRFNFLKIKNLIRYLFNSYSKIIVCRYDFHFEYSDSRDLDKCNALFTKLITETINRYNGYLGYVCSREYSETEGIHFHCYFFLDGQLYKNDYSFYSEVLGKWKKIGGKSVHNVYLNRDRLPDKGECLGLIKYTELEKIEKLIYLIRYLLKDINEREWLERLGIEGKRRLITSSHVGDKIDLGNAFKPNYFRDFIVDYSWIDKIKLSTNKRIVTRDSKKEYLIKN
nr:MAG TPA: Inovirus Gp2 [Caudoviricetes sp.]